MRQFFLIITVFFASLLLVSCIKDVDTSKYQGKYILDNYVTEYDELTNELKLVTSYEILLDEKGRSTEKYQLGLMEEVTTVSSTFTINEERNEIEFRYIVDKYSTYTLTRSYQTEYIVIKDLQIAIVKDADESNNEHFAKATITLKRVI